MDELEMYLRHFQIMEGMIREVELRGEELTQPAQLWYLSFAKDKEEGGFQGAVIVPAHGMVTALDRVNELGINPGGSVMAVPVPPGVTIRPESTDRLLNREELESVVGPVETRPNGPGTQVCEHCNEDHGPERMH